MTLGTRFFINIQLIFFKNSYWLLIIKKEELNETFE